MHTLTFPGYVQLDLFDFFILKSFVFCVYASRAILLFNQFKLCQINRSASSINRSIRWSFFRPKFLKSVRRQDKSRLWLIRTPLDGSVGQAVIDKKTRAVIEVKKRKWNFLRKRSRKLWIHWLGCLEQSRPDATWWSSSCVAERIALDIFL